MSTEKLVCYKQMPEWDVDTLPKGFKSKHNTKEGTWAKLTIISGQLKFFILEEDGSAASEHLFSVENQPEYIEPQVYHRIEPVTDDFKCRLSFYCREQDYVAKKYGLTPTHSEVMNLLPHLKPNSSILDLGCGQGRNTLLLNYKGHAVDAVDANPGSLMTLRSIIEKEGLENINVSDYDINEAKITQSYDVIISTVVLMFLNRDRIPDVIKNMQEKTNPKGYNLIVAAMSTEDFPCPVNFPFTFSENELADYYQGWDIIDYRETLGELHKVDAEGNRIKLKFATLLAQKQ